MSIVVYTALVGNIDFLKDQHKSEGVNYLCFTDATGLTSGTWNIVSIHPKYEHPRISAKRFKCLPHLFLPKDCTHSIWIDATTVITSPDFIPMCIDALKSQPFAMMNHPESDCAYEEAKSCAWSEKYVGERLMEQMAHYRVSGFPGHLGLAAGQVIVRDMRSPIVQKVGEDWFHENLMWSSLDRVSLPYALWRNKTWFDPLPFATADRKHFTTFKHLRND